MYNQQRTICESLGVMQSLYCARKMRGTNSPPTPTGNVIYSGPGVMTEGPSEFSQQTLVWWSNMPFLRGEQRQEETDFGLSSTPLLQSQIPAVDDNGNVLPVKEGDVMIDAAGNRYRIANPTLTPDGSLWVFMGIAER